MEMPYTNDIDFKYNGREFAAAYLGCGDYLEISDVKLHHNGKSRSIQTTDAFDAMVMEKIDA
ncbi:hypothetical protein L0663_05290 [Dyadobacter sp. CY107]|uniref:hypothetical protein n=1 Tax=Dyadobacter fanqingshengii TaxID=2906443 RepID=UPI001F4412B6|nr:hypothetical protein [Dyadobacter fanqingshengii]MCF2502781.1 hypothetical protein [Dyadobacter fanqingshengii]